MSISSLTVPSLNRVRPLVLRFPPGATLKVNGLTTIISSVGAEVIFLGSSFTIDGLNDDNERGDVPIFSLSRSSSFQFPLIPPPACDGIRDVRELLRCTRKTSKSIAQHLTYPVVVKGGSFNLASSTVQLTGLDFQVGSPTGSSHRYIRASSCDKLIVNLCRFVGGRTTIPESSGGCMFVSQSQLTMREVLFRQCYSAGNAGAVYVNADSLYVDIAMCLFEDNSAGDVSEVRGKELH